MNQQIIDRAVNMATRAALAGRPLAQVLWVPPATATDNPLGKFVAVECGELTASEIPPWEK